MQDRRRRLRNDHEPQLTTAAKHFVADMDSRARPGWRSVANAGSGESGEGVPPIISAPFRCQSLLDQLQRRFHISGTADHRQNLRATAVAQRE
jgi:hypothetical protein